MNSTRQDIQQQLTHGGKQPLASAARSRVRAALHLSFELRRPALPNGNSQIDGTRTMLKTTLQEPPLKVVRAFDPGDGSALVHLHNVSGGLLGDDDLALKANLASGTRVQLTTTGATRLYRPRATAASARLTTEIAVGEGALLEYVPDPLIPYAGSRYAQHTSIHLAPGAGLFWWEIVAPGREARGECFEYERLDIHTDLLAGGRRIAIERVRLEPVSQNVNSLARLGYYRTWATFYICRVGENAATWRALEQNLREVAEKLNHPSETLWGVSPLVAHGVAVRALAINGRGIHTGLHALWRVAKCSLYGSEPVPPRKVN